MSWTQLQLFPDDQAQQDRFVALCTANKAGRFDALTGYPAGPLGGGRWTVETWDPYLDICYQEGYAAGAAELAKAGEAPR